MTDRNVRQVSSPSEGKEQEHPRPFSEFAERTNLVLLGDPGAGKSHLFRESAATVGGRFLSARAFLNIPTFPPDAVLFVDGLDEKRAGRGDQGTVDAMAQKLFSVAPSKVRISCRAADWLGESDLAAFQPYFDLGGGVVVVGLERLSPDEQRAVLASQDIIATEADAFVREAQDRGLSDFLDNPQNLIMLVEAVKTGNWPANRKELFELSTRLLLSEPNREHTRVGGGTYGADELRETAGAICAVRLISDVDGISLAEHEGNPDYPSYRSVNFLKPEKAQAVLGRRVFTTGPIAESVDYAHRTTAEYLGADWLVGKIRAGLPLGRVQALMGVDGHPASELRGLHAWLTVLLPEHADLLIDADPYGVLTYGDAGSLTPSSRRHLLAALGRLSETDPWFRAGNWQSPAMGALARPDMIEAFRSVLSSEGANFGLRSVVVDALAAGTPLPALQNDLVEVLVRGQSDYAERSHALVALVRLGSDGKDAVATAYRDQFGHDASSISLRAEIVTSLYGEFYGPADVATLMGETLKCDEEVVTGTLWSISSRIPTGDIPAVLDRFEPIERELRSTLERRNVWEVASTFERLLLRLLQETEGKLEANEILRLLRVWQAFRETYGGARITSVRDALRQKPALLRAMAVAFFEALVVDANRWLTYSEFREATAHAIDPDDLLEWIVTYLRRVARGSDKELFLYEVALSLSFNESSRAQEAFAVLFAWGDARADLRAVRDASISCVIPDWRLRRNGRMEDEEDDDEDSQSRRRNFETNAGAIRSGAHLNWLAWAARVYFGSFSDLEQQATPHERLVEVLGEANAGTAIEGFIAVLQRPDLPTLDRVAALSGEHRYFPWWHAIIAGLDERWKQVPGLADLPDNLVRSALAIELANPTFERGETTERRQHNWKRAVFDDRADLARDAYVAVARAKLLKGEQQAEGLHDLLSDEAFMDSRKDVTLQFLREFPNASPFRLDELLRSALGTPAAHLELLVLARSVLARTVVVDEDRRDMWLAAAYFASPREFEAEVEAVAQDRPGLVWLLRDLSGYQRHGDEQQPLALPLSQLEFLARITGSLFPEAPFPSDGWSGDTNPWDAAELVRYLVNLISAIPSEAATAALAHLESDPRLSSYRDHIRHGLANQRTRRREAEYDQPNWPQAVRALANGPPANVADLHALLVAHLTDLKQRIASTNTDIYKWFWNEDSHGRIQTPKPEESCRDVLVGLLRPGLMPLGITVEPEGHMAANRSADISVAMPGRKVVCELKRDYHTDVWSAAEGQLDRFYTSDPEAKGFGVYGVFWFGEKRPSVIPAPPKGMSRPGSAAEMVEMFRELIPREKQSRLAVVVFDVSGIR